MKISLTISNTHHTFIKFRVLCFFFFFAFAHIYVNANFKHAWRLCSNRNVNVPELHSSSLSPSFIAKFRRLAEILEFGGFGGRYIRSERTTAAHNVILHL